MKEKVLLLVNHDVAIYNFRLELIEALINLGYEVHISSPYGERIEDLINLGVIYHEIHIDRHGKNPIKELVLINKYKKLMQNVNPIMVFSYTIKPNLYGSIAAKKFNIPFVANITGLGTAVESPGLTQYITIVLYRYAFRGIKKVFFQNTENQQFFIDNNIAIGKHGLLPGSGVNLKRFSLIDYPNNDVIKFAFISRIMKEKGIDQYLEAAKTIKKDYNNVEFHICGFCEEEYNGKLKEYCNSGIVKYHGMIRDVHSFISNMNCIVHPSYYPEGMSNILLESCATGRPIITTDRSGCREVVENGVNGYMIKTENTEELIAAIRKFISLSYAEQKKMGLSARNKVEKEFDREIVVNAYLSELQNIIN